MFSLLQQQGETELLNSASEEVNTVTELTTLPMEAHSLIGNCVAVMCSGL